jgi:hypothetical protein
VVEMGLFCALVGIFRRTCQAVVAVGQTVLQLALLARGAEGGGGRGRGGGGGEEEERRWNMVHERTTGRREGQRGTEKPHVYLSQQVVIRAELAGFELVDAFLDRLVLPLDLFLRLHAVFFLLLAGLVTGGD